MSQSVFPRGNKLQTVDSMIDYVEFIRSIAEREGFHNALGAFDDTITALKSERATRALNSRPPLRKSA
jgi:hypothetical protein